MARQTTTICLLFFYSVVGLLRSPSGFCDQQTVGPYSEDYLQATRYYEQGHYETALYFFQKALQGNETYLNRSPHVQFKIGYCFFKTGYYESAIRILESEIAHISSIEDYSRFYILEATLALGDTSPVIKGLQQFKQQFHDSPLIPQTDSLLAELYFRQKEWAKAAPYYQKLLRYREFDKGDSYGKLIQISRALVNHEKLQEYAFSLISNYPFHPQSLLAYEELSRLYAKRLIPHSKLRMLFNYLAKTKQFEEIDRLLNRQIVLGGQTELTRWLRIRKKYIQENYWATFQACKLQRDKFTQYQFIREVDLHIARCYRRLGVIDKAIEAYDAFQRKYPKDRLAAEVLWVIAWLCEDLGKVDEAQEYYLKLISQYPRSEFVDEARFRIGLTYYRRENYEMARFQWTNALQTSTEPSLKDRYRYWVAKAYAKEGDFPNYSANLALLAKDPFANYYNLKSFLLTRTGAQIQQFVDSLLWTMHHKQSSYLPEYVDLFQRPLIVQELIGDRFARKELDQLVEHSSISGWEAFFAIGELNERLQNYGNAYRLYRKVFAENFARKDWQEWIFLFKQLYPLYFDGEVNEYARKRNIASASIWAIIKKESAFEPQIMSYANAYGLMQIIPPTAKRLFKELGMEIDDVRRLYDPNINIRLGSYYLSELLKRYEGNLYHALAAYNAGEHRVDHWRTLMDIDDNDFFMENIRFEQTRSYVRGVMKFYWTYHLLINPHTIPKERPAFPEQITFDRWFQDAGVYD